MIQVARPRPKVVPARRAMSVEAQWQKVASLIEGVIRRGETAADLHRAAALRIDSTDYEIQLLKNDLARVLSHHCGARA